MSLLSRLLDRAAALFPANTAVIDGHYVYSYAELKQLVDRLASSLLGLGVTPNDRIAVLMHNRPEMLLCYYACFKIGATVVPINYCLKAPEIAYIIENSQPKLLICENKLFPEVKKILPNFTGLTACFLVDRQATGTESTLDFNDLLASTVSAQIPKIDADTIAAVIHTSGTTGTPKGTLLTHRQLAAHTVSHAQLVKYCSDDKSLLCLALCCNFGFTHQMLPAAYTGAALVIMPVFDAARVLAAIQHQQVTMLYMMPVMYNKLANLAATHHPPIANQLRLCVVAGDVTPSSVFKQFKTCFGLDLCEGLGMTETQVYALNPVSGDKKIGSVGRPIATLQVEIQDEQGQTLPGGETGEIVVKGEVVTSGYLNNPQATAETFRDDWFLTGDLGCFDREGYLWFKGRKKQIIIRGGSNISPQEVEEAFYQYPSILEAAAIGVPDKILGERVRAYLVLKPGSRPISETAIINFARQRLADYKVPESVKFMNELPKGITGKIDRRKLHEQALTEC